jgi:hypothetical protein
VDVDISERKEKVRIKRTVPHPKRSGKRLYHYSGEYQVVRKSVITRVVPAGAYVEALVSALRNSSRV